MGQNTCGGLTFIIFRISLTDCGNDRDSLHGECLPTPEPGTTINQLQRVFRPLLQWYHQKMPSEGVQSYSWEKTKGDLFPFRASA
jgi:hypothetical protein